MKNLKERFIDIFQNKHLYPQYLSSREKCENFVSEMESEYEKAFGTILFNDNMNENSLANEIRSNLKRRVGTSFEDYNQKRGRGVPHALLNSHLIPLLQGEPVKVDRNQLYEDFQKVFPLESLEAMTLEKYTNLNREDSFCYWVESRTYNLGSYWGGSSYKFGIYRYNKRPDDVRIQSDDKYAWYKKYNKASAEEAFALVREAIVKVAHYARSGEFDQIEKVDLLGDSYKWKIAFLYSDKKLVPVYKREMLERVAKHFGMENPAEKKTYVLQMFIFEKKADQDLFDFYENLIPILDADNSAQRYSGEDDVKKLESTLDSVPHDGKYDGGSADGRKWWLNANPSIWSAGMGWKVGASVEYTLTNEHGHKRRIYQNYLDAQAGDKVVCYESTPTKQIVALAEVTFKNETHIGFKKLANLTTPVDYADLRLIPELEEMEFFKNPNGSFFKLTDQEYDVILDLISVSDAPVEDEATDKYTEKDFLDEVYMTRENLHTLEHLLRYKKNVILQGAPGVGKTFSAKRLAYKMMGRKDEKRICMVQFHQNYSYEDFVLGYKPVEEGFKLQEGKFYTFCRQAANDPNGEYFFIIDEINRGNVSKIFGELLMAIESGYRGTKIRLAYGEREFTVPENLYIIGMMNTADRSLALIDYALRRRFSFFKMKPAFDTEGFQKMMDKIKNEKFKKLVEEVKKLNKTISGDGSLGEGFEIGHSYFSIGEKDIDKVDDEWLNGVVEYEIIPMLEEYWFDNAKMLDEQKEKLRTALK